MAALEISNEHRPPGPQTKISFPCFPNLNSHWLFIAGKARRSVFFKRKKKKNKKQIALYRQLPSPALRCLKSSSVDRLCFRFHQWKEVRPEELMDSKLRCVFELPLENEKTVRTPVSNLKCIFSFHITAAPSVLSQNIVIICFFSHIYFELFH